MIQNINTLTLDNIPTLPPRAIDCNKGQLGHVLVIAGGKGMGGSGILAAQSSLKLGAGLVTLATISEHISACLTRQPEIMVHAIDNSEFIHEPLSKATVVLIGPGLGQNDWATKLLDIVSGYDLVQIWDADALNLLAQHPNRWRVKNEWVLTPHPGEAARLLGCSNKVIQASRVDSALQIASKYCATTILKGFQSIIVSYNNDISKCINGHPVMAGAGFGDVLGGVIAAFVAQGLSAYQASKLAVYIHAIAGENNAVHGRGLAAGDLYIDMRQVLEKLCPTTLKTNGKST